LPVRKRAAVLVLLFADRWGDLRVVITMRAASLRSFSGKEETPCMLFYKSLKDGMNLLG
jgi:coenzyme A diphosphatase NUDT7